MEVRNTSLHYDFLLTICRVEFYELHGREAVAAMTTCLPPYCACVVIRKPTEDYLPIHVNLTLSFHESMTLIPDSSETLER